MKEVADIFLFGSAIKGKEFPEDMDICVVFKQKVSNEVLLELEKILKEFKVHISSLTVDNFFSKPHSLIKTMLVEGVSLINEKPFIQNFGFLSSALYSYNLSELKLSEKVKFIYLLKGRKNNEGIVKKFGGEWLADSCFIIPITKDSEMLAILKKWLIPFKRKEVLIH
jgi:predicted nucleotidyltransferase